MAISSQSIMQGGALLTLRTRDNTGAAFPATRNYSQPQSHGWGFL